MKRELHPAARTISASPYPVSLYPYLDSVGQALRIGDRPPLSKDRSPAGAHPPHGAAPENSPCGKALGMVYGDRARDYDHPRRNFDRIRVLWSAYINGKYGTSIELDRRDVAWLNILQKCARDQHNQMPDNLIDTAGYAEAMFRAEES